MYLRFTGFILLIFFPWALSLAGRARLTFYESYARCCPDNSNYDPSVDSTECDVYSACKYSGDFAVIGHQSLGYVKNNSLISFYQHGDEDWENFYSYFAGMNITLSINGISYEALVADTCGDSDCDGCCSENSAETGYLIDLEYYTMLSIFGDESSMDDHADFFINVSYTPDLDDDMSSNDFLSLEVIVVLSITLLVVVVLVVVFCRYYCSCQSNHQRKEIFEIVHMTPNRFEEAGGSNHDENESESEIKSVQLNLSTMFASSSEGFCRNNPNLSPSRLNEISI